MEIIPEWRGQKGFAAGDGRGKKGFAPGGAVKMILPPAGVPNGPIYRREKAFRPAESLFLPYAKYYA